MNINLTEHELFKKKWFDYRHLTPDEATWVFICEWRKFCKKYFRLIGHEDRHILKFKGYEIHEIQACKGPRFWVVMTEMRRWADLHCLDYSEFWSISFNNLTIMTFGSNWLSIFSEKQFRSNVLIYIQEQREMIIRMSQFKKFADPSFQKTPIAREYQQYLIDEAKKKFIGEALDAALLNFVRQGHLPENIINKIN